MHLSTEQQNAVLAVVESLPWAEIKGNTETLESALRLALELTQEQFAFWHEHAEPAGFESELDRVEIAELPADWTFALVARLLRTIALSYGLRTEFGPGPLGAVCSHPTHASTPVRRLLAIW
jgi:hypothetical protein